MAPPTSTALRIQSGAVPMNQSMVSRECLSARESQVLSPAPKNSHLMVSHSPPQIAAIFAEHAQPGARTTSPVQPTESRASSCCVGAMCTPIVRKRRRTRDMKWDKHDGRRWFLFP